MDSENIVDINDVLHTKCDINFSKKIENHLHEKYSTHRQSFYSLNPTKKKIRTHLSTIFQLGQMSQFKRSRTFSPSSISEVARQMHPSR